MDTVTLEADGSVVLWDGATHGKQFAPECVNTEGATVYSPPTEEVIVDEVAGEGEGAGNETMAEHEMEDHAGNETMTEGDETTDEGEPLAGGVDGSGAFKRALTFTSFAAVVGFLFVLVCEDSLDM